MRFQVDVLLSYACTKIQARFLRDGVHTVWACTVIPFWSSWESPEMWGALQGENLRDFPTSAGWSWFSLSHTRFSYGIAKVWFLKMIALLGMYEIMKVCFLTINQNDHMFLNFNMIPANKYIVDSCWSDCNSV